MSISSNWIIIYIFIIHSNHSSFCTSPSKYDILGIAKIRCKLEPLTRIIDWPIAGAFILSLLRLSLVGAAGVASASMVLEGEANSCGRLVLLLVWSPVASENHPYGGFGSCRIVTFPSGPICFRNLTLSSWRLKMRLFFYIRTFWAARISFIF